MPGHLPEVAIPLLRAVAVLAMMLWSSYSDVRERRVPNWTWYPFLALGLALVGADLLSEPSTRIPGYFLLAAPLVYGVLHLGVDEEGWDRLFERYLSFRGAGYLFYLAAVLLVLGGLRLATATGSRLLRGFSVSVFVAVLFVFGVRRLEERLGRPLIGGADLKALLVLSVLLPVFPSWVPVPGIFGLPVLSVLMNALFLAMLYPVLLLSRNLQKGATEHPVLMFIGTPLPLGSIDPLRMRLLERVEEGELVVSQNPVEVTEEELEDLENLGKEEAWVTYMMPFMIPLTGGVIVTLVLGDLYTIVVLALA